MSAGEAPRTEAGRNILQALRKEYQPGTMGYMAAGTWVPLIIAIEREAAAAPPEPPLDVERLDKVLRESSLSTIAWNEVHALLTEIAAEYARLSPSSGESAHKPWCVLPPTHRYGCESALPDDHHSHTESSSGESE